MIINDFPLVDRYLVCYLTCKNYRERETDLGEWVDNIKVIWEFPSTGFSCRVHLRDSVEMSTICTKQSSVLGFSFCLQTIPHRHGNDKYPALMEQSRALSC